MTTTTAQKVCPVCRHEFRGNGWDGIDAHWRRKHEQIMPYEQARPMIQAASEFEVDELNDPEASYRRGYQQGAYAALEAVKATTIDEMKDWIEVKLARWRYLDHPGDRWKRPPLP